MDNRPKYRDLASSLRDCDANQRKTAWELAEGLISFSERIDMLGFAILRDDIGNLDDAFLRDALLAAAEGDQSVIEDLPRRIEKENFLPRKIEMAIMAAAAESIADKEYGEALRKRLVSILPDDMAGEFQT